MNNGTNINIKRNKTLIPEPINIEDTITHSISLVPYSGIQFLDFSLSFKKGKIKRFHLEKAQEYERLVEVFEDEDSGDYVDSRGEKVLSSDMDEDLLPKSSKEKIIKSFEKAWLPFPMLRIMERGSKGDVKYDKGPLNWVRFRLVELPEVDENGNTHRLVLAIDTKLLKRTSSRPYAAPDFEDVPNNSEFQLVSAVTDIAWLHDSEWSKSIVEEVYDTYLYQTLGERKYTKVRNEISSLVIWAEFANLISLIDDVNVIPCIRFIDTVSQSGDDEIIKVDLALDMGNSRTCGVFVESSGRDCIDFNSSYSLELRDLSSAEHVYNEPFPSRVEFRKESFGNNRLSMKSRTDAFHWISPVRVGWEAARLSSLASGADGVSGISSPKRYLWDTKEQIREWYFNTYAKQDGAPILSSASTGSFFRYLTNSGEAWDESDQESTPATRAKYSRSSMMMFYLSEIFSQAMMQINSYRLRKKRPFTDVPRRLNRIILTMPTAMTIPERKQFEKWAHLALRIVASEARISDFQLPEILMQWDEATGTQVVFLYNEIKSNFRGDMDLFFKTNANLGRRENNDAIRVASIDIGGGTTDLIITSYSAADGSTITPNQEIGEGFNIAGDDILRAIIEEHVLISFERGLSACGVRSPAELLAYLLGGGRANDDIRRSTLQRQFAQQIAIPCALEIIARYEAFDPSKGDVRKNINCGQLLVNDKSPHRDVITFIQDAVKEFGGSGFSLDDVLMEISLSAVDKTVSHTIGPILGDMCELIYHYDCDYLLLSGRPSIMPGVQNAVVSKLPLSVDRIIAMNNYPVGDWYPYRNNSGFLNDPKTTAAVGAMVCALSEGHLQRFTLLSRKLQMKSTISYIGTMEETGHIKNSNLYFEDIDLDSELAGEGSDLVATVKFSAPMHVGFRQLDVERWPATPLFKVEFRDPGKARKLALPLNLTIGLIPRDEDRRFKVFDVQDVEDAQGNPISSKEVHFSLQTMLDSLGYWTDTGVFKITMH